jgi:hypothetical protein
MLTNEIIVMMIMLTSVFRVFLCLLIVQRAAKCLDHTITIYVVHFFITVLYKGFPVYWEWWVVMIVNIVVTAVLGEYTCYRVESRDIPLTAPTNTSQNSLMDDDDEDSNDTTTDQSTDHIINVEERTS